MDLPLPSPIDFHVLCETRSPADTAVAGDAVSWRGATGVGSRIGPFEISGFLGRGGMGQVYKALDTRLGRSVALKLIRVERPGVERRFQREARAQAKIDHDAVCRVFEVGEVDGAPFIAMQFIEGRTLDLCASDLSLEEKISVMCQVGEAIQAAHAEALVHRDLKPSNIMVQMQDGGPKAWVLDFGMAHEGGDARLTTTGEVIGTPHYMAPEQVLGDQKVVDRRTDVYGLGAVFYEILSGRPPIPGKNVLDVLRRVPEEEPEPLRHLRPELPEDLEWIVLRCLEKEPGNRYPSVKKLVDDLERYRLGEPITSRHTSRFYYWRKRLRKHRHALGTLALVGALVSGFVGREWVQRRDAHERAHWTAHFVREIEDLEWRLRVVNSLPLHDVGPEKKQLIRRLDRLKSDVDRAGKMGLGPGLYALGRGYQLLGSEDRAFEHLKQAWDLGFRDSGLSHSLGLAYGRRFERALSSLELIPEPEAQSRRKRAAELDLRDVATARLREVESQDREDYLWATASLAFYERRFDDAWGHLDTLLGLSPWRHEALGLKASVLMAQADETENPEQAGPLLDRAESLLHSALKIGESDPSLYRLSCALNTDRAERMSISDTLDPDRRQALLQPCERSVQADSTDADSYAVAADLWGVLAERLNLAGHEDGGDYAHEAIRLAGRALDLDPSHLPALNTSATSHLALVSLARGVEGRDYHLAAALKQGRRISQLDPDFLGGKLTVAYALLIKASIVIEQRLDPGAVFTSIEDELAPLLDGAEPNEDAVVLAALSRLEDAKWQATRRAGRPWQALQEARHVVAGADLQLPMLDLAVCLTHLELERAEDLPFSSSSECVEAVDRLIERDPGDLDWSAIKVVIMTRLYEREPRREAEAIIQNLLRQLEDRPVFGRRSLPALRGRWNLARAETSPGSSSHRAALAARATEDLALSAAATGSLTDLVAKVEASLLQVLSAVQQGKHAQAARLWADARADLDRALERDDLYLRALVAARVAEELRSHLGFGKVATAASSGAEGGPSIPTWSELEREPGARHALQRWRAHLEASGTGEGKNIEISTTISAP